MLARVSKSAWIPAPEEGSLAAKTRTRGGAKAAKGERKRFICVAGGPRISNKLAVELGFDAGFGKGSYAEDVATFVAKKIVERKKE